MNASAEIRKKLATLIGHLISRCIREARMIPAVLHREEVINMLVDDPGLFAKLVHDEHDDNTELSKQDLTVRLDAVAELAKLDSLEVFDKSFWDGPEVELPPILDRTNQLTRTFAVYLGNAATLFDREFEAFMNKFRQSLQQAGMSIRTVDFTLEDMSSFEDISAAYFDAGEALQAFTFEKLLSSQIMMKQVVSLPRDYSLRENLIRRALKNPKLLPSIFRFVIRISYISQGSWEDMFPVLLRIIREESVEGSSAKLVAAVEQDIVFSCNLLCKSYEEIRQLTSDQRKRAIASSLENYSNKTNCLSGFH
jgi:hypothetical protein